MPLPRLQLFELEDLPWFPPAIRDLATAICEALAADQISVQFTLTDKYPNIPAFERLSSRNPAGIRYIAAPVDATDVPENVTGLRTMFNAFHHFAPEPARLVLQNAVQARQPVGIFEIPERNVIPLIPLTCWWDGLVFACRVPDAPRS